MAFQLNKRAFKDEVRVFRVFLMLFGLLPIWSKTKWKFVSLMYTLCILTSLIMISVSAFWINNMIDPKLSSLSVIVSVLLFCGVVLANFITFIQVYSMRSYQEEMYEKFDQIASLFQNRLSTQIDYDHLRWKFYKKFLYLLLALIGTNLTQFIVILIFDKYFLYVLHMLIPIILLRLRCLQNVFYVDLINYFLCTIIDNLKFILNHNEGDGTLKFQYLLVDYKYAWRNIERSRYEQICILKEIYGKLWDISNLINDSFGWSLLAIITQSFIEFTTYGYWMFLSLENIIENTFAIGVYYEMFKFLIQLILASIPRNYTLYNIIGFLLKCISICLSL